MKELLTNEQLIEHMKKKGIQFNIINENEAKDFLRNNNYYMKLASYRTNYEKQKCECETEGQYINLEFAYLKELSTIDMHLRYLIIKMCLDIEHHLKLHILNGLEKEGDDGYQLIRKFVARNENALKNIHSHRASEYCKDLIEKYYPYFPAWVFVELISFGNLTYLCEFYSKIYGVEIIDSKFLNIVRDLRNASAHSNCLINKLPNEIKGVADTRIINFIKEFGCIGKTSLNNNIKHVFVYNFSVLLYVYDTIITSESIKQTRYNELKEFANVRVVRHADYFMKNNMIKSQYKFIKKIIDSL